MTSAEGTVDGVAPRLPSVDALVRRCAPESARVRRTAAVHQARRLLDRWRKAGTDATLDFAASELGDHFKRLGERLRPAINATGILLHTNLGRAPLEPHCGETGWAYGDVEMELATGERGSRLSRLERLAQALWGPPAAAVVNNNAAALVLAVRATALAGTVIVSRGEAVQIGGGFRIPAIVEASGARLLEVGTTNITTVQDYADAIDRCDGKVVILRVHRSNFALVGHAESPTDHALGTLARERKVPFVVDQGGGATESLRLALKDAYGAVIPEPTVEKILEDGATLVTFSGDKLLGGTQAGFIVGDAAAVTRAKKDPLARAFRLDKVRVAALEQILGEWLSPEPQLPFLERLLTPVSVLEERAQQLVDALLQLGLSVEVSAFHTPLGGGATPTWELPSAGFRWKCGEGEGAFRRLLGGVPAVVPRRDRGQLLFDLRSVAADEDATLFARLVESGAAP